MCISEENRFSSATTKSPKTWSVIKTMLRQQLDASACLKRLCDEIAQHKLSWMSNWRPEQDMFWIVGDDPSRKFKFDYEMVTRDLIVKHYHRELPISAVADAEHFLQKYPFMATIRNNPAKALSLYVQQKKWVRKEMIQSNLHSNSVRKLDAEGLGMEELDMEEPGMEEPGMKESGMEEPDVEELVAIEADAAGLNATRLNAMESDATDLIATRSGVAGLDTMKLDATEPDFSVAGTSHVDQDSPSSLISSDTMTAPELSSPAQPLNLTAVANTMDTNKSDSENVLLNMSDRDVGEKQDNLTTLKIHGKPLLWTLAEKDILKQIFVEKIYNIPRKVWREKGMCSVPGLTHRTWGSDIAKARRTNGMVTWCYHCLTPLYN